MLPKNSRDFQELNQIKHSGLEGIRSKDRYPLHLNQAITSVVNLSGTGIGPLHIP